MKYDGEQLRWLSMSLVRTIGTPGDSSSIDEVHIEVPVSKAAPSVSEDNDHATQRWYI